MKKNKILSVMLCVVMWFSILPQNTFTVSAVTEGYYTYTVENGEATITNCANSISGDIEIPPTLGGYPVTSIGCEAFFNKEITSITIPESITSIGENAFIWCEELIDVKISNISEWLQIDFYNGSSNPMRYADNIYLNGNLITHIDIPNEITTIKNYSMYGFQELTSVNIPKNIIEIGNYSFANCTNLTTITIPDSVTNIGYSAFSNCYSLTDITIPDSITNMGDSVFFSCTNLTNVILSNSITNIAEAMFFWCNNLKNITLPHGILCIKDCAFYGCENLDNIYIHNTVTNIGIQAFDGCNSLDKIYYCGTEEDWNSINIDSYNDNLSTATKLFLNEHDHHTFSDWKIKINATCTSNGEEYRTCLSCGEEETRIILATGHTYSSVITSPTCTKQGYTTYTCADCGDNYLDNYTEALEHSFGEWIIKINVPCTIEGEEYRICSSCGEEETRIILATEHTYSSVITSPTCTKQGYTTYTCADCGNSYIDNYTEVLEHSFGDWTIKTKVTCTTEGEEYHICSSCGEEETQSISATGHKYNSVITLPTCTEQGYTTYTCENCEDSYIDNYTEALGHDFDMEYTIDTFPTETEKGSKSRHCTRCDGVTDVTVILRKIILHRYRDREKIYTSSKTELDIPWVLYDAQIEYTHTDFKYVTKSSDYFGMENSYCIHDKIYTLRYVNNYNSGKWFYATPSEFMNMDASIILSYSADNETYYEYKYCTSKIPYEVYYYYSWSKWGEWSTWSETQYTASDDVEVEKIQTYDETLDSENLIILRKTLLNDKNDMLLDYNADETLDIRDLIRLKKYLLSV